MKFRDVHTMNLVTVNLFNLHYETTGPTALERDAFNNCKLILAGIFS